MIGRERFDFSPPLTIHQKEVVSGKPEEVPFKECRVIRQKGVSVILPKSIAIAHSGPNSSPKFTESCCACLAIVLAKGRQSTLVHLSPAYMRYLDVQKQFKKILESFKGLNEEGVFEGIVCGGLMAGNWDIRAEYPRFSNFVLGDIKRSLPGVHLTQLPQKREWGFTDVYVEEQATDVWVVNSVGLKRLRWKPLGNF